MGRCWRTCWSVALGLVRACLVVAVAIGVAGVDGTAISAEGTITRQKSSHEASFFRDLLIGRVWVYQKVSAVSPSVRDFGSAAYFHADGRVTICTATSSEAIDNSGRWRVVPSDRFVALFNYLQPGSEPDPAEVRSHVPIFYDSATGQLHSEKWISGDTWQVFLRGWVQESWPAGLDAVCPEMKPSGVRVNERQKSVVFWQLVREDASAAMRGFAGSGLRVPGSKGLAAVGHQPTFSGDDLRDWLVENNGMVVRGGVLRYVLVLGGRGDEVWLLEDETDVVIDTIKLVPSEDGDGVVLQYTVAPIRVLYRVGYPLGLVSTGRRYGAMAVMDWLVEGGKSVGLPFMNRENVAFRFLGDGTVRTGTRSGREIGGEWWWSEGMLHVWVEGIDSVNTFEWRALAEHVGWSG